MEAVIFKNLTDKELYQLCQKYGNNIKFWKRKFAALLPEVEKRKLYKKYGFYSIYEFAGKIGCLGRKTVEEILRTHRRIENKPLLKAELEKEGWGKVRAITPLIESTEEKDLVNMIKSLPKSALEQTVKEIKKQEGQTPPGWGCEPVTVSFKIDKNTDFRLRKFQQKLEKEKKEKIPFGEVLKALLDQVESNSQKRTKKPKIAQTKITRYVPVRIQRNIQRKCAYPNCNKPAAVNHHPDRFALTKNHEKITPLCEKHHKIAHAGLIQNEKDEPQKWKIQKIPNQADPKFKIDQKVQKYYSPPFFVYKL